MDLGFRAKYRVDAVCEQIFPSKFPLPPGEGERGWKLAFPGA